jgi:uncharacterized membrane protein
MNTFLRAIRARPRQTAGMFAGLVAFILLPPGRAVSTRGIEAWDIGCLVFLLLVAAWFSGERTGRMPADAAAQEEGEWTIFWLTVAGVAASFAAIITEFSGLKDLTPAARGLDVALVAVTLLVSWLMTHTLFALRYAHEYYGVSAPGGPIDGGLAFPDDATPDYWDFFYFALVLGMTFQVSDVQITSRKLRRLAAAHGLLGFLFNTVILALSVNIGASLLS